VLVSIFNEHRIICRRTVLIWKRVYAPVRVIWSILIIYFQLFLNTTAVLPKLGRWMHEVAATRHRGRSIFTREFVVIVLKRVEFSLEHCCFVCFTSLTAVIKPLYPCDSYWLHRCWIALFGWILVLVRLSISNCIVCVFNPEFIRGISFFKETEFLLLFLC
jgi:hypothetical protein